MDRGILYRASGKQYVREAEISAKSVKENTDGIETCIITDNDVNSQYIDIVISESEMSSDVSSSIIRPNETPFEKTLFLDTDTHVYSDITDLFEVLHYCDLACTLSPTQRKLPEMAEPFREYNTGVILYNDCKRVNEFLDCWYDRYQKLRKSERITRNQPSFSLCVHENDISLFVLSREYNCFARSIGYLTFDAKILHGRPQSTLSDAASKLNKTVERRTYNTRPGLFSDTVVKVDTRANNRIYSRFFSSLRKNGLKYTLKRGISELLGASADQKEGDH